MLFLFYIFIFVLSYSVVRIQSRSRLFGHFIDEPNFRSSHSIATRSSGGVSIILLLWIGLSILEAIGYPIVTTWSVLLICATAMGAVGLIDDVVDISAKIRLVAQFILASITITWILVTETSLHIIYSDRPLVISVLLLTALLSYVWFINLYNFMDGIDGYAASQTIFVYSITCFLILAGTNNTETHLLFYLMALFTVIMLAFIIFNWPKAALFMGDTGSGFIGFLLAGLVIICLIQNLMTLKTWLIILSLFLIDSTVALTRRCFLGKVIYEAHRSHAYQNIARKYNSHFVATTLGISVNLFLVAPAALISHFMPVYSTHSLILVYSVLGMVLYAIGSGREGMYEA